MKILVGCDGRLLQIRDTQEALNLFRGITDGGRRPGNMCRRHQHQCKRGTSTITMYTWSETNLLIFSSVTSLHGSVPLTVCWLFESMHPRILICVVAYLSDDFCGKKQHEDAAAQHTGALGQSPLRAVFAKRTALFLQPAPNAPARMKLTPCR